ncbi:MAG: DUF4390 domain-containing protein [Pseudomonadota bacterium]|jgi:hypothetical protein|nr:MAG: hypothetical protein DIU62_08195 [Pseudomonadota bacterium]
MKGIAARMRPRTVLAVLLLPFIAVAAARAGEEDFKVRAAWVNVRDAVFEVNARIEYPLDPRVQAALDAGASVHFDLQCMVVKENRYWFDSTVVDVELERELTWNGLTQRYVLREGEHSEQQSFATLDEALAAAGQVVNWPVVVGPQLESNASYYIRVRAAYRRGSPARLRALMPWGDDWSRRTEWHTWTLPH